MGKAIRESSVEVRLGKFQNWECLFVNREKGLFLSRYQTGWDKVEHHFDMENSQRKESSWWNQHESSTMFIWVVLKENVKSARILWIIEEVSSNQGFLLGLQKKCQKQKPRGNLMPKQYLHGPMTWKVMQRNACTYIAN